MKLENIVLNASQSEKATDGMSIYIKCSEYSDLWGQKIWLPEGPERNMDSHC